MEHPWSLPLCLHSPFPLPLLGIPWEDSPTVYGTRGTISHGSCFPPSAAGAGWPEQFVQGWLQEAREATHRLPPGLLGLEDAGTVLPAR